MADDTNLWDDIFTTNIDDYTYDADDYSIESYLDDSWDTDLWGGSDQYDDFGLADLFDNYNFDDTFSAGDYDVGSAEFTDWLDSYLDDPFGLNDEDDINYYGADDYSWIDDYEYGDVIPNVENMDFTPEGQISAWMENWLEEQDPTYNARDPYDFGEEESGNWFLEFIKTMTGNMGNNPPRSGNQMGAVGQYLGDFLSSPLAALLLMNQKNKDAREQVNIPMGQEAYGSGAGVGSLPDYRISNIQPALLPGMAYANQPTTFNNTPPGMQAGGLTSHNHPQLHSHGSTHPDDAVPGMPGARRLPFRPKFGTPEYEALMNNGMQSGGVASLENMMDGPGDITQAMLEPGEFVMTRKATENLTPEYLYSLMHQAENAGRMT